MSKKIKLEREAKREKKLSTWTRSRHLKKRLKNEVYEIPLSILVKYQQEVFSPENHYLDIVRSRCHQQTYEDFTSAEVPSNLANFSTAFKHALEDRNFKVLYDLLSKALKIRNSFLLQQVYEYLYIAIQHDEMIPDKDDVLSQFLARIRLLNDCDNKTYQVREHTFSYVKNNETEDEMPVVEVKEQPEEVIKSDSDKVIKSDDSDSDREKSR